LEQVRVTLRETRRPGSHITAPAIKKVLDRLHQAGCPVDCSGSAWLDVTRFAGLCAYERGPDARHAEVAKKPNSCAYRSRAAAIAGCREGKR